MWKIARYQSPYICTSQQTHRAIGNQLAAKQSILLPLVVLLANLVCSFWFFLDFFKIFRFLFVNWKFFRSPDITTKVETSNWKDGNQAKYVFSHHFSSWPPLPVLSDFLGGFPPVFFVFWAGGDFLPENSQNSWNVSELAIGKMATQQSLLVPLVLLATFVCTTTATSYQWPPHEVFYPMSFDKRTLSKRGNSGLVILTKLEGWVRMGRE